MKTTLPTMACEVTIEQRSELIRIVKEKGYTICIREDEYLAVWDTANESNGFNSALCGCRDENSYESSLEWFAERGIDMTCALLPFKTFKSLLLTLKPKGNSHA